MSNQERDLLDVDDAVARLTNQNPTRGYSGYYYVINDGERDLLLAAWPRIKARIAELEADNSTLYHAVAQEAQKSLELEAENAALRTLLLEAARDAQFQDKHIHPVGGQVYQNWRLDVYLPVPLNETDKSVERALEAAIEQVKGRK